MVFGQVYAIRSHQTKDLYIGSTTQALSMRMAHHRRIHKYYSNKTYHNVSSFEILQYDAYIELLIEGEFESKKALQKKKVNINVKWSVSIKELLVEQGNNFMMKIKNKF